MVDLENLKPRDIKDLRQFGSKNLNLDSIMNVALEKKYLRNIESIFKTEIENPSDEFAKFFATQITDKRMTSAIIEQFKGYIKKAFKEIINDLAYEKITNIKNGLSQNEQIIESVQTITKILTKRASLPLKRSYRDTTSCGAFWVKLEQISMI